MGRAEDVFQSVVDQGVEAIDELVATRQSESLFLDFKRSADNGQGVRLHTTDRENFAKAISGFGNSEGGVIIWGIDCSNDKDGADVPHTLCLLTDPSRFAGWLERVVSGCTVPPHTGVQNKAVIVDSSKNEGYVISYIPVSYNAPHQIVGNTKNSFRYYIRAGSNFEPAPHGVLAGMFGRKPQPHLIHQYMNEPASIEQSKIKIRITIMLKNLGPGIARDVFLNVLAYGEIGPNCQIGFAPDNPSTWNSQFILGVNFSSISKPDFRLAPETYAMPLSITFWLSPPFETELEMDITYGCSNSPVTKIELKRDKETIDSLYNDFLEKTKNGLMTEKESFDTSKRLFEAT